MDMTKSRKGVRGESLDTFYACIYGLIRPHLLPKPLVPVGLALYDC